MGSNLFSLMFMQQDKIEKNMAISKKAMNVDDLIKLAKSSPQGAEMALDKSWENLNIAAGEALIPIVIPALLKLAEGFRALGGVIDRHPVRFKYLIEGAAALSGLALAAGSVMIFTAALKAFGLVMQVEGAAMRVSPLGLIVTGIAAVVVDGLYVYEHWKTIKPKLVAVWDGIKSWIGGIVDWLQGVWQGITNGVSNAGKFLSDSKPSSSNRGFAPPSGGGGNIVINNHMDPEKNTQSVANRMTGRMRGPATSSSASNGRMTPTHAGTSGAW